MRVSARIERLEQAEGHLLVIGALRAPPDLVAATPPVLRIIPRQGEALSWPLRRLVPRTDLPAAEGMPAGLGFVLLLASTAHWDAGRAEMDWGGPVMPLPLPPIAPFRPRGVLEAPTRQGLRGWVLDLPGRAPALLVEGRIAVPLNPDRPRRDLAFDGSAGPLGFRLTLEALGEAVRATAPGLALLDGEARPLALLAGGVEVARQALRWPRRMNGRLDRATAGEVTGWVSELDAGETPPAVDLLLDGTRWQTIPVHAEEPAPPGLEGQVRSGAFRGTLPQLNPGGAAAPELVARPAHGRRDLPGAVRLEGLPPPPAAPLLAPLPPGAAPPRVAIVIPIHNAAADLERCLDAVIRHTTGPARLILLDDASTEPAVAALLARHEGRPGIEIHRNPRNLGFTATANRGFGLAGRDDVVLLNSDTAVGPGWLEGLRLAAGSDPRVGTVTPLSNNAGAFSVPEFNAENRLPPGFAPADLARLARQATLALLPAVPTGNGFCLYLRRACLDAVGGFDEVAFPRGYGEENDFCLRAGRAGFRHLLDDRTLVWHRKAASFGEARHGRIAQAREVLAARYPDYATLTRIFEEGPDHLAIRWRMRRAVEGALAARGTPLPRILFVIATETGGTPQTNRDLMAALADRFDPWLLRCEAGEMVLSRHGEGEVERLRLPDPPGPATHRSDAYDAALAGMLLRHGFELVHVRHIAWHGIGLTEVCRRIGVPVVFSFHDFYAACPTVKLLDAEGRFCGGTCTKGAGTEGAGDCVPELWRPEAMPPLRGRFLHRWREMMAGMLEGCDAFVTTSAFARDTLSAVFPFLAERDVRLIPHGRDFAAMQALAEEPRADAPLRVLVPGNISRAKGGALVAAMAARDAGRRVEFHILGRVDPKVLPAGPGVVRHGTYAREAFAAHLGAIRPHLGAVLSLWPETHCHTLTECWAAGLPVLATALGAQGDRLAATGAGWLLDPAATPEAVLDRLEAIRRDAAGWRAARDAVLAWQAGPGLRESTTAMAAQYEALYRDVLDRRRSFRLPGEAADQPARSTSIPVQATVRLRMSPGGE